MEFKNTNSFVVTNMTGKDFLEDMEDFYKEGKYVDVVDKIVDFFNSTASRNIFSVSHEMLEDIATQDEVIEETNTAIINNFNSEIDIRDKNYINPYEVKDIKQIISIMLPEFENKLSNPKNESMNLNNDNILSNFLSVELPDYMELAGDHYNEISKETAKNLINYFKDLV